MKKKAVKDGIVFSTDPAFNPNDTIHPAEETLEESRQPLRVKLDKKQRAGKLVTLVVGFAGTEKDLEDLGRRMKNFCGTGGSVKSGEIIIQGDHRDKVLQWLKKNGYEMARIAG